MFNIDKIRRFTQSLWNGVYRIGLDPIANRIVSVLPWESVLPSIWLLHYEYYQNLSNSYRSRLKRNSIEVEGKKILEIGSGNSFGVGYFLLPECREFVSSDFSRSPQMSPMSIRREKEIIERVESDYNKDLSKFYSISQSGREFRLEKPACFLSKFDVCAVDIEQYPIELGSFDLILSMAVLEHIPKEGVTQAAKNMYKLLKPGGFICHKIDLRDHYNFSYPFRFYRYDEETWNRLCRGTVFYTNRLRCNDFIKVFSEQGFDIRNTEISENELNEETIDPSFRGRDDLNISGLAIIAQKQ